MDQRTLADVAFRENKVSLSIAGAGSNGRGMVVAVLLVAVVAVLLVACVVTMPVIVACENIH